MADYKPPKQTFGEVVKKDDTKIVINLQPYGNKDYVDIRENWKPEDKEDFVPTKKGFTLPADGSEASIEMIDALITSLQRAKDYMQGLP
jgi:hypothetical protein